jgi:hypothetical protein
VYNITGQLLLKETLQESGLINLEKLPKGIYLLKVESQSSKSVVKRIVKD